MSHKIDARFEDVAPPETLALFAELGLPAPNPLWYVGPILTRPVVAEPLRRNRPMAIIFALTVEKRKTRLHSWQHRYAKE